MRGILIAMVLVGCGKAAEPARCATTTEPPVPAAEVCAHLADLGCRFEPNPEEMDGGAGDPCLDGYAEWAVAVAPDEFAAVTHCYLGASSCEAVDGCNRTCGAGGGPVQVGDAGTSVPDAGAEDGGIDAGGMDGGGVDAGPVDAGREMPDAMADRDAMLPDAMPPLPDVGIGIDSGP